mgnify:CR=1 FL=1|tara:strand:+ start:167 stop:406 length:240 start_codon:yes stop_codon:yes gene_type:complete
MLSQIPERLSILSKNGARKVLVLEKRTAYLESRIDRLKSIGSKYGYDKAELEAIQWVLRRLLLLEKETHQNGERVPSAT